MSKQQCVLATTNRGKIAEMQSIFSLIQWDVIPQSDFNVPKVEETGLSYVENAILKARHASLHTGLPAIADDSGIEVNVLKGEPGIYSARYAGIDATPQARNQKLIDALANFADPNDRKACFQCVIVYMRYPNDPMPLMGVGSWHGIILPQPQGDMGHGYDPILFIPELGRTPAQMTMELKNQFSHRAKAMRMLLEQLDPSLYSGQ